MHLATCPHQDRAFFDLLQQQADLDQRDNRGKKHSMALVLMGVVMALLAGRDGNLPAIQRHMKTSIKPCRLRWLYKPHGSFPVPSYRACWPR